MSSAVSLMVAFYLSAVYCAKVLLDCGRAGWVRGGC